MHVVVSLGNALHVGSKSCLYEFTELNFLSVGSQLPPRTLNIYWSIDWLIDSKALLTINTSWQLLFLETKETMYTKETFYTKETLNTKETVLDQMLPFRTEIVGLRVDLKATRCACTESCRPIEDCLWHTQSTNGPALRTTLCPPSVMKAWCESQCTFDTTRWWRP